MKLVFEEVKKGAKKFSYEKRVAKRFFSRGKRGREPFWKKLGG